MSYFIQNFSEILRRTGEHFFILSISLLFAGIIGIPLGVYISNKERVANFIIRISSIFFTVPSLALFGILVIALSPLNLGVGKAPAIIALSLYSLLPIIRNTYVSIKQTDPGIVEAARGMGMTDLQIIMKIRIPLSLPVIMAGIRNAAVLGVGITTVGFLVGAGGLGYFIFEGIERSNKGMILSGTMMIILLGIGINYGLILLEERIRPGKRGFKKG